MQAVGLGVQSNPVRSFEEGQKPCDLFFSIDHGKKYMNNSR